MDFLKNSLHTFISYTYLAVSIGTASTFIFDSILVRPYAADPLSKLITEVAAADLATSGGNYPFFCEMSNSASLQKLVIDSV